MGSKAGKRAYVVAGTKPWNRRIFEEVISSYPGYWSFVSQPEQLNTDWLTTTNPKYIFFLHWSWRVPDEIFKDYECVCFHMTDVPYGRGGSPLQNLISREHTRTKVTALKMVEKMDAGPVYLKEDLCIESGCAEEIYIRATYKAAKMIQRIILEDIEPVPQEGAPTVFKRRRPDESEIPSIENLQQLYDFIRMLDAEGYPQAFLCYNGFRYEFSHAVRYDGRIEADVTITSLEGDE